jgi:hypothetical protein
LCLRGLAKHEPKYSHAPGGRIELDKATPRAKLWLRQDARPVAEKQFFKTDAHST